MRFVGFTYNGEQIVRYLDGLADSGPSYTDETGNTTTESPWTFDSGVLRRFHRHCSRTLGG
ncbi:MAG: hypothetical protein V7607_5653 [Solirubrobacteraceae bacterium]